MCEFCSGQSKRKDVVFVDSTTYMEAQIEVIFEGCYDCHGDRIYIDINYCPVCGRKIDIKKE